MILCIFLERDVSDVRCYQVNMALVLYVIDDCKNKLSNEDMYLLYPTKIKRGTKEKEYQKISCQKMGVCSSRDLIREVIADSRICSQDMKWRQ